MRLEIFCPVSDRQLGYAYSVIIDCCIHALNSVLCRAWCCYCCRVGHARNGSPEPVIVWLYGKSARGNGIRGIGIRNESLHVSNDLRRIVAHYVRAEPGAYPFCAVH